jgi:hypothetical protein
MVSIAAAKLEKHPSIRLAIDRGRKKVERKVEYGLERAVEMALDDWGQAKELGQIGAAVSSNRLAADLLGLLIERKRDLNADEDPINQLLASIAGKSRATPETKH